MKQLRKKALLPALSMALASVIALSGVTYAWFTTSPTAMVTGMDVNVKAANGIQISLDAIQWRSAISGDDIQKFINGKSADVYPNAVNQYPAKDVEIMPVSTIGKVADGKMEMFFGKIGDDGLLSTQVEAEANRTNGGNFVAFDLFINSSFEQNLKLDQVGVLSTVGASTAFNGNENAKTETAVRVAFISLGCAATAEEAWELNDATSETALIWEPNSDKHAVGVVDAEGKAPEGKVDYDGIKAEFTGKELTALTSEDAAKVTTFDETRDIVDLGQGINKIRIYIWLEGQDVDCVNQISFGDFVTNLNFSVPKVSEGA